MEISTLAKDSVHAGLTKSSPLVTIGIASYNNARYITETLDSIFALDYPNKEVIIVDDCSTDNSVIVINGWLQAHPDLNVRLIEHEVNKGVCQVCNRVVREADGVFLALIGSDDLYKPNMLSATVAEMHRRGARCGAVYADCELIDSGGGLLKKSFMEHFNARFGPNYPTGNIRLPLLNGFYLPAPTVLMRKQALLQAGPYDENLRAEDLDMWLRISEQWEFAFLPQVVASYRVHQFSATQANKPGLNETYFQIYRKNRFLLNAEQDAAKRMLVDHAEHYYSSKGTAASAALWYAYRETGQAKLLVFWLMARLGVKYTTLRKMVGR